MDRHFTNAQGDSVACAAADVAVAAQKASANVQCWNEREI
jgi:hypothetical protein